MNREIKFRVYDKDLKKMRYLNNSHDFICFDEKGNGYYHNMQTGLGEWFSDLMQYTGLKDKNGIEIYEGDILYTHRIQSGENSGNSYKTVKWVNDKRKSGFNISNGISKNWEVIGNIYKNEE